MAIDKSIMQAPMGLPSGEEPLDVIIDDLVEDDGEGGVIVTLGEDRKQSTEHGKNLAEELTDDVLTSLSSTLLADFDADEQSRSEWLKTYKDGIELLGLKYDERTEPWKGACGVFNPLLMESAVKFQSETMMETFPAAGPVRAKIIGKETAEKREAALRVEEDMNYRLIEQMQEYRPEHERMLFNLCLSGNAFKKIYFDPNLNRQTAMFVSAEDLVVPYGASSLESAERVTHKMRKTKNEIRKLQVAGFYRDVELGEPQQVLDEAEKLRQKEQGYSASVIDKRHLLLEMCVTLNLEGYEDPDGIELPYIVTIDKSTGKILSIYRNWLEDDELKAKRQHYVHYGYVPGFGFYYYGMIHLIGGHAKASTSLLRQLIDAGTLSNIPGGFKSKGMRVKGDSSPIGPGEWMDVDVPNGAIRDNILPLPYKEPSATLLQLMDRVVEDGRRFAATADLKISDMSAQAPVGTTLAVLERMLKVMSAVQARIHYAMKQEFKLLKNIIRDQTQDTYEYEPDTGQPAAKQADYDMVDVIPVSDPNAATMSQRVVQYQAVLELAKLAPQLYDQQLLHRQMIETLGIKNANKLVPSPDDMKPVDPVTENMNILNGKPVKAFLYQDHDAHLQVHLSAMQDPKIMAMVGQNPQAQLLQGAAMAHVMEHVAFQYRKEIERMLGATLPPIPEQGNADEEAEHILPPEVEVQLSQLVAQAAAKLLQKDVAEAQAMQAQAQQNDPLYQLQMRDIAVKEAEVQRKQQKDILDAAAKADDQEMRKQEMAARQQLDAIKVLLDAAKNQDQLTMQQQTEAMRILTDIAKTEDEMSLRREEGDRKVQTDMAKHQNEMSLRKEEGERSVRADLTKHGANLADRHAERTARREESMRRDSNDMTKFGHQMADKSEERKAKAEQAKTQAKKPAKKE